MRLVSFVLGLYLCLMALYPCNDRETCADDARISRLSVPVAANTDDHEHSGSEHDLCTPLCICSCCTTFIQLVYALELPRPLPYHGCVVLTRYSENVVADNSYVVWQPPRIV